mgnify:CR=1 FL=1
MKLKTKIILSMTVIVLSFAIWFIAKRTVPVEASIYDDFAQCLAHQNITMYGAEWCPACQAQKNEFKGAFKYVPYVECPQDPQKCLAAGIEAYPTWIFSSGEKIVGVQPLETLAQKTGCALTLTFQ